MPPSKVRPVGKIEKANLMLYARPGWGKTQLIGTHRQTLIIRPPIDHTTSILDPNVMEWEVKDWAEMTNEVFEYLRHDVHKDFDWVWLDSISLWQQVGLDDIWRDVIAEKPHRDKYGKDKPEYGKNMDRLAMWVRDVVSLPGFNFGITAHPAEMTDPETGEVVMMPFVQGKNMSQSICGYMNVVMHGSLDDKGRRIIRTDLHDSYEAKDQFNAFGGLMVNPTMPKIIEAIRATPKGSNIPSLAAQPAKRRRRITKKRGT